MTLGKYLPCLKPWITLPNPQGTLGNQHEVENQLKRSSKDMTSPNMERDTQMARKDRKK